MIPGISIVRTDLNSERISISKCLDIEIGIKYLNERCLFENVPIKDRKSFCKHHIVEPVLRQLKHLGELVDYEIRVSNKRGSMSNAVNVGITLTFPNRSRQLMLLSVVLGEETKMVSQDFYF